MRPDIQEQTPSVGAYLHQEYSRIVNYRGDVIRAAILSALEYHVTNPSLPPDERVMAEDSLERLGVSHVAAEETNHTAEEEPDIWLTEEDFKAEGIKLRGYNTGLASRLWHSLRRRHGSLAVARRNLTNKNDLPDWLIEHSEEAIRRYSDFEGLFNDDYRLSFKRFKALFNMDKVRTEGIGVGSMAVARQIIEAKSPRPENVDDLLALMNDPGMVAVMRQAVADEKVTRERPFSRQIRSFDFPVRNDPIFGSWVRSKLGDEAALSTLEALDQREREILTERFNFDPPGTLSTEEVRQSYEETRRRIAEIEG